MSQRLKLAKNLLSESGVIFISIDDNEYAHLKLLCDEIFFESNSIGPFIQNKLNTKNDTLNIQKNHEYILVYRNKELKVKGKTVPTLINESILTKEVLQDNGRFFYISDPITTRGDGGILNNRKNLGYTIYYNPMTGDFKGVMDYDLNLAKTSNNENDIYTSDMSLINEGYICIRPPKVRGKLGAWTWECDRFNTRHSEIFIKKNRNGYSVNKKIFVPQELVYELNGKYFYDSYNENGNSKSIVEFSTNDGTDRFNQILEAGSFNNPKNVDMIKFFISLHKNKSGIILDFFAGSGTTGQAILELNNDDRGERKFILCTNNENGIAEEICYPRLKKVIEGYGGVEGIPTNLRYFKTSFVSKSKISDDTRTDLVHKSTEMICVRENTFNKIIDDENYKIYENNDIATGILFRLDALEDFKKAIERVNKEAHIYVFSLSNDTYNRDFEDLSIPHILCPIPESILEVYRRLFKET